jgi:hypothetical protein
MWRYFIHHELRGTAAAALGWNRCRASIPASAADKNEPGQLTWISVPASILGYCHHMKAARVLTLAERALFAEWVACAGDIGEA